MTSGTDTRSALWHSNRTDRRCATSSAVAVRTLSVAGLQTLGFCLKHRENDQRGATAIGTHLVKSLRYGQRCKLNLVGFAQSSTAKWGRSSGGKAATSKDAEAGRLLAWSSLTVPGSCCAVQSSWITNLVNVHSLSKSRSLGEKDRPKRKIISAFCAYSSASVVGSGQLSLSQGIMFWSVMVNAYSRSGDIVDGIKLGEFGTMLMKIGVDSNRNPSQAALSALSERPTRRLTPLAASTTSAPSRVEKDIVAFRSDEDGKSAKSQGVMRDQASADLRCVAGAINVTTRAHDRLGVIVEQPSYEAADSYMQLRSVPEPRGSRRSSKMTDECADALV
ncbi:hypothetical protein L1887_63075 [Cichorium endivia]|nr:hypothetical protein L1887_63075 [Cichorium endivia]